MKFEIIASEIVVAHPPPHVFALFLVDKKIHTYKKKRKKPESVWFSLLLTVWQRDRIIFNDGHTHIIIYEIIGGK